MSLRKSPTRTPALLAANRASAARSTGPRTREGKARASLNSLKQGTYASRLQETLILAGDRQGQALYRRVQEEIYRTFLPQDARSWRDLERVARRVWRRIQQAVGGKDHKTKPECLSKQRGNPSQPNLFPIHRVRIRIGNQRQQAKLVVWTQRHRCWTYERWVRLMDDVLAGKEPLAPLPEGRLEHRLRVQRFYPRRPGVKQRASLPEPPEPHGELGGPSTA